MKLLFTMLGCGLFLLWGCSDTGVTMDPTKKKATIDSLVQVHSQYLRDSIDHACAYRLRSEVIAKSDSIMLAKKAEADANANN